MVMANKKHLGASYIKIVTKENIVEAKNTNGTTYSFGYKLKYSCTHFKCLRIFIFSNPIYSYQLLKG